MLRDLTNIFIHTAKIKFMRGMQYRLDFVTGLFISMLISSLYPLIAFLIFVNTKGYKNWSVEQMILFQGIMIFWLGLKDVIFGEVRGSIEAIVKNGAFDLLLLKPVSAIGMVITGGFYYQGFGGVMAGLIIVIWSIARMGIAIDVWSIILLLLCVIIGLVLYVAFLIFYCSLVIKLIRMNRLSEVMDKILMFANYPADIYQKVMRTIIMVFVPIGIWAYFPAKIILGRGHAGMIYAGLFSAILLLISLIVWDKVVRKYTSAGG